MNAALTRRGVALLVAAGAGYASGEWLGYPLLRTLAAVAVVAVAVSVVAAARPVRLAVTRHLDRDRVHRGRSVEVRLTVHNAGRWWTPRFAARDGEPVSVPSLRPGRAVTVTYTLTPTHRGRLTVGPLRVEQVDPLGLTDRRRTAGDTRELWVYPKLHPVAPIDGSPRRRHLAGSSSGATLRGSLELRALRPYVPGDEPRHIHWKATAATGDLMVRDLYDPPEPDLVVVLDTDPAALTPALFEEAVDFTASVLVSATRAGHRARLRTTDGLELRAGHLEALCTVEQRRGKAVLSPVSGTAVLVTGTSTMDVPWLALSGRPVLCVLGEPAGSARGVTVLSGIDAAALTGRWNAAVR